MQVSIKRNQKLIASPKPVIQEGDDEPPDPNPCIKAIPSPAPPDAACRLVITDAGYGDEFGHGTGHGVGLEVHEAPSLGQTKGDVLAQGMVCTVEPGIYIPERVGIRIEDTVLVRIERAEERLTVGGIGFGERGGPEVPHAVAVDVLEEQESAVHADLVDEVLPAAALEARPGRRACRVRPRRG